VHALNLLQKEIDINLALLGCPSTTGLSPQYLQAQG
jgi:L-lactate dehydrogenase (cytochrome)